MQCDLRRQNIIDKHLFYVLDALNKVSINHAINLLELNTSLVKIKYINERSRIFDRISNSSHNQMIWIIFIMQQNWSMLCVKARNVTESWLVSLWKLRNKKRQSRKLALPCSMLVDRTRLIAAAGLVLSAIN